MRSNQGGGGVKVPCFIWGKAKPIAEFEGSSQRFTFKTCAGCEKKPKIEEVSELVDS